MSYLWKTLVYKLKVLTKFLAGLIKKKKGHTSGHMLLKLLDLQNVNKTIKSFKT